MRNLIIGLALFFVACSNVVTPKQEVEYLKLNTNQIEIYYQDSYWNYTWLSVSFYEHYLYTHSLKVDYVNDMNQVDSFDVRGTNFSITLHFTDGHKETHIVSEVTYNMSPEGGILNVSHVSYYLNQITYFIIQ